MTEKYKILSNYVKDMSSETPDVESFLFTKDNINKYELDIDISSKPLKNKLIEVNTNLKFQNKSKPDKKSYFEVVYASIVTIEETVKEKKELQKIILCDIQNEIYPKLEKILLNLLIDSGYPGVKFDKKVDFNKLFNEKFN
ncbi:MAG: protein-export chaperone SecB [Candidatus Pelagibacter sp.]|jgi:preprotein translocase subunit SecB|tara:strand:+ start:129 stop:551 length:423 start_codon:yes stop_codon:yes gene_type:complete